MNGARGRTAEGDEGLAKAAQRAPTEIMRTIAREAIDQGHTFGSLAATLNEREQTALEASNVRNHFSAKRPRSATVDAYARALGLDSADLRIFSGIGTLSPEKSRSEIQRLRRDLLTSTWFLDDDSVHESLACLDKASPAELTRIATRYFRAFRGDRPTYGGDIARALEGDLPLIVRNPVPGENWLDGIFGIAEPKLGESGAEALVALAVGLLRRCGVDTSPDEARLATARRMRKLYDAETDRKAPH